MTHQPLISIVMPSFNQAAYIEESILSVIRQSYNRWELIVVDGGSTDGTAEILRRHKSHISHCLIEPDRGQSDALNKGFRIASGQIFGWLNSDDLYEQGAFARAAEVFSSRPDISVVYGDHLEFGEEIGESRVFSFDFSLGQFIFEGFHLNAQAMFWRSDLHRRFGDFDVSLHRTMDYDMILRFAQLCKQTGFKRVDQVFGKFRRHELQKTRGINDVVKSEHRYIAEKLNLRGKYGTAAPVWRAIYRLRRAYWYARRGGIMYAVRSGLKSVARTR